MMIVLEAMFVKRMEVAKQTWDTCVKKIRNVLSKTQFVVKKYQQSAHHKRTASTPAKVELYLRSTIGRDYQHLQQNQ